MRLVLVALVLVLVAPAAWAQDTLSRPLFLSAMGLLSTETVRIEAPDMPVIEFDMPSSDAVSLRVAEVPQNSSDVLAAYEFVTVEGLLAESLVLTKASVDQTEPEERRFAMANLLVLRSFPALRANEETARLIGFGPMERDDDIVATQMIGGFVSPDGPEIFFRHAGLAFEGTDAAIVAIANINQSLMPVRSDDQLDDTFTGYVLNSLRVVPTAE